MVELINIINSVADSNVAYYALIGVLVIVVLSMIYLIYSQNKEMEELQKERKELEYNISENDDMVEEIAKKVKKEKTKNKQIEIEVAEEEEKDFKPVKEEVIYEEAEVKPVDKRHEPTIEEIKPAVQHEWHEETVKPTRIRQEIREDELPKAAKNLITEIKEEKEEKPIVIKEVTNWDEPRIKKVHTLETVDLPREKKLELIDATLTNIPNLSLLDATMTNLPNVLEYDYEEEKPKENEELLSITRELELAPKERIVKMTDYEKEQEKKAIISYDELLDHKEEILADIEEAEQAEPVVQEFQPEENVAISIDEALEAKEEVPVEEVVPVEEENPVEEEVHIAPELEYVDVPEEPYEEVHEEEPIEEASIEEEPVEEEIPSENTKRTGYEYEENFLAQLKSLQSKLN